MKRDLIYALSLTCAMAGCAHQSGAEAREERAEARAEHNAREHHAAVDADGQRDLPKRRDPSNQLATAGDELPAHDADNSGINARDRGDGALTPMDQGNGEIDLDLTQRIRKAVVADDSLSFGAKNVKIISKNGHVTLRGPVKSAEEKTAIGKAALSAAGVGHVTNDLEVARD